MQLWTDKYIPKTIGDIKGNGEAIKKSIAFISTYTTPRPERKILLFSGPPGSGKTSLAKIIAKACNIDYVMLNCSADRNPQLLKEKLSPYIDDSSVDGSKVIIILDELDGQRAKSEFFPFLEKFLKLNTNPIIATCNDSYRLPKPFSTDSCVPIRFHRQGDSTIRNILIDIAMKEKINIPNDQLDKIIIKSDIRASISAFQIYAMSGYILPQIEHDRNKYTETRSVLQHVTDIHPSVDLRDLLLFVEENGTNKVSGVDRYHFYKILEEVSVLLASYRTDEARQLLGNISLSYTFPQTTDEYVKINTHPHITKLFLTKNLRNSLQSLSLKLAPKFLVSSSTFRTALFPVIQLLSQNNLDYARSLTLYHSLERDEIALLLDTTTNDPRINKILIPDKLLTKSPTIPIQVPLTEYDDLL